MWKGAHAIILLLARKAPYRANFGNFAQNHINFTYECGANMVYDEIMHETRMDIDQTDSRLLAALQRDAHLTAQELGEALGLSASQAGRRRQRLEELGLITGYSARLDPARLGLHVQAFVQVQMARHGADTSTVFARLISLQAEIVSAWTLTGEADYLLRVYCESLADLNRLIHQVLLAHPTVARVQSQIVMDQFKPDAPLPT
jgi:DNA-binding Lrp family transcriptional regulator